jgi:hypothetical protein
MYFQAHFPSYIPSYIPIRPNNYSIILFNSGINLEIQSVCVYMHYICPHTAICVLYVSSYCYMCLMCPHTAICVLYVSSYSICVLMIQSVCVYMRAHAILLYMCPHTSIYVPSYFYICLYVSS